MEQNSKISWVNVFKIGGAFTAFQIGAGFASGQEVMQYFGTYGGMYPMIMPLIALVLVTFYCIATFYTGYTERFEDPNDAYEYFCGSALGKIINILTNLVIGLTCLAMFAGCGATIHQYLGAPVWAGALGICRSACWRRTYRLTEG